MIRNIKDKQLAIGLMSGTSADGIDAVLVSIEGNYTSTKVKQLAFINEPIPEEVREAILSAASGSFGGSAFICKLNFILGRLLADAGLLVCKKADISPLDIDLIGSHGQTVFHQPVEEKFLGMNIKSTLQIGEPSVIAEAFPNSLVVSDFRVRDVAAGGLGAPLVPYSEYLLYSDNDRCVALQNIGGIGNITVIPKGAGLKDITAFDTGPGNMLIDATVSEYTKGKMHYDKDGEMASKGKVSRTLLDWLMQDPYLKQQPPKNTGREYYGREYLKKITEFADEHNLEQNDVIATVTMFTAKSIEYSIRHLCSVIPDRLIIGGGGSYNPVLLADIRSCLSELEIMTNEELGFDSDSKEAVAFAILANETVHGAVNNVTGATGAGHPVVMGKISQ